MDEIIVRVLRAVACQTRLRILSFLVRTDESAPTDVARGLGLPLSLVCAHLRRLSAAALVQRRRSGAWCYCRAQSPYRGEAFSARITSWLRRALTGQAVDCVEAELHKTIFEAATAFANVRRLQILRRLAGGDIVEGRTLTKELRMSGPAVTRHMGKLVRRGYVTLSRAGRCLAYRLAAKGKTRIHSELLRIVRASWEKGLRS